MRCACGSRAVYVTIDGEDVCGPCLRASGVGARMPTLLLELETERRHVAAPPPPVEPAPAPKPAAPVNPKARECIRCHRVLSIKSRGVCSGCYSFGLRTDTLDSFALPPATDWLRAASAKGVEARLAKAAS